MCTCLDTFRDREYEVPAKSCGTVFQSTPDYFICRAQTTGSPVIIPVTPEVKVEIFRGDCVTPVTGAVSPGDPLCMVIGIENGFQGIKTNAFEK